MEKPICNDFLNRKCSRTDCKYKHVCSHFWKFNKCKFNDKCEFEHVKNTNESSDKMPRTKTSEERYKESIGKPRTSEELFEKALGTQPQRTSEERYREAREKQQRADLDKQTDKRTSEERYKEAREKHNAAQPQAQAQAQAQEKAKQTKGKQKRNKDKYNKNKERNAALKKIKNTESFEPIYEKQTDLRIVLHKTHDSFNQTLSQKDVLIVPDLFKDFYEGELYKQLLDEIHNCGIPKETLFKLWHGDSHLIADDHLHWKTKCPTFNMVISRIQSYFNMDIKATRFNYYPDSSTFKPMHFDASAVKPEKAKIQNFTLAISFGATRDAAFEHATTKTIISLPQTDGYIYAFCKDINITWRHGILKKERPEGPPEGPPEGIEGRISIICWGWLDQSN